MKRLVAVLGLVTLFACTEAPKDYATVSGKIENAHESNTLKIFKGRDYEKIITIKENGTFSDTLKIVEGTYNFQHGEQYGEIYLKNNNETSITTDYNNFDQSLVFGGDAADINNFSIQSFLIGNEFFDEELINTATKESMDEAVEEYKSAYAKLKKEFNTVDSAHIARMDENIEMTSKQIQQYLASKIALRSAFPKGSPSPLFEGYENFKGINTSLSDLKGKYVYMDIWATWCGPCKFEIPSLKKIEKQFEGKNIEFVSISVDEGRGYNGDAEAAYKGWRKMIEDEDLGGTQLLADNGFRSQFIQDYKINAIPRFILVDPNGNIVSADAPRPSDPSLVDFLEGLGI